MGIESMRAPVLNTKDKFMVQQNLNIYDDEMWKFQLPDLDQKTSLKLVITFLFLSQSFKNDTRKSMGR